tara:strand:+ start:1212 stop:4499 length:3288 start_codon:yes stop_codon:yes gene_type:complete
MYRLITGFVIITFSVLSAREWVEVRSSRPAEPVFNLETHPAGNIEISFELSGYFLDEENNSYRISFPGGVPILEKGAPDLPRMARSIQIPDMAHMELMVMDVEYVEIPFDNILPSKGNLTRDVNIQDVPFVTGDVYEKDAFYPRSTSFLRDPYIIRTVRGQAIVFQPIQYNPVQKLLRIHSRLVVSIKANGISTVNPLLRRPVNGGLNREIDHIYREHFLNYSSPTARYEPVNEDGSMLIICYGAFMETMQPLVDWKNKKGTFTEIIDVAEIGDDDAIKAYVENYYYDHGLTFLLLVGDIDQIPSPRFSEGAGSNSPADPYYGFIVGNDYYPDVFVGRFSAENSTHVETMVNRTVQYERYPGAGEEWYKKGSGFASDQGPGDDGEYDDEHLDIIREKLLDYTYVEIDQIYDPNGTVAEGEAAINEGRSIINYTGHGSNSSWGNGCPMNNTNVNSLVNVDKWPFIWSVACVNGEFHVGTCFAETWLRATDDGEPTGAVATFMSTVNAAWSPPMDAQDEFNDIFVESYSNNIKRTFGGISSNGCMHMNDNYGSSGDVETLYWTIFGDPSFVVRSDTPGNLNVTHDDILIIGGDMFSLQTDNTEALAALSLDGILLGSAYADENGTVMIQLDEPVEIPDELDLVVTAYNQIPYETTINVIAPDGSYMLMDAYQYISGDDDQVAFGESVDLIVSVENVGTEPSGVITATLVPQTGNVSMVTEILEGSSIASGEIIEIGPFQFDVSINIPDQGEIIFILVIQDGEASWEYEIVLTADAPDYQLLSSMIFDGGNGALDPGESATIQIVMENTGNAPLNYPTFAGYSNDPYLTVTEVGGDNAYYWETGTSAIVNGNIVVSNDAPIGYTAVMWLDIGSLDTDYQFTYPIPLTFGMLMEGFETGDFSAHVWELSGNNDWFVQDSEVFDGNFAARTGDINNDQTSELSVTFNVIYQGPISFYAKASSEQGASGILYDYLAFYIDDQEQVKIGGMTDWEEYSFNVPSGEHVFRWTYQKDHAQSSGQDCAWLDQIIFPAGSIPPLNIDFGDLNGDGSVNVLDVVLTVSSVLGYSTLTAGQALAADMNMDGSVDVLDITLIIDLLFAN